MSSLSKEQKIHDLAVAYATAEYETECFRWWPSNVGVETSKKTDILYDLYVDAVECFNNPEKYPVLFDDQSQQ